MRAWRAHALGTSLDVLRLEELPEPEPGAGEALVEVEAVGLNFADNLMLAGQYQVKMPLPFTPGIELAGRVLAVGAGAQLPLGQRVIVEGIDRGGALAERVVAPAGSLYPIPEGMSAADAAALYIIYLTGHLALHRRARIQPGETLLVHAGAGGVGSAAIQLGVAAGARVIATAGGADKVALCKSLGAELAIDYRTEDFAPIVKDATGGRGADVIYDPVGGDVFDQSRRCIAWEGRLLVIGFTSGRIAQLPLNHVLLKNYAVLGVYAGEYRKMNPALTQAVVADIVRLYTAGQIRPLIREEVPLTEAPAALVRIAQRDSVGKVIVRLR